MMTGRLTVTIVVAAVDVQPPTLPILNVQLFALMAPPSNSSLQTNGQSPRAVPRLQMRMLTTKHQGETILKGNGIIRTNERQSIMF
jgi:hypothetical protein